MNGIGCGVGWVVRLCEQCRMWVGWVVRLGEWCRVWVGWVPFNIALCPAGSIYQRRGAKRWKKIKRINGHAFIPKRFAHAYCAICDDRIWGLGRQVCMYYPVALLVFVT